MYGKLVNGELIEAPSSYTAEDGTVINGFNQSIFYMVKYGFKPVEQMIPPYDAYSQRIVFSRYEEEVDRIVKYYDVVDKLKPDSYEELQVKVNTLEEELVNTQSAIDYILMSKMDSIETPTDDNIPSKEDGSDTINSSDINDTTVTSLGNINILSDDDSKGGENGMAKYLASRIMKGFLPYKIVYVFPMFKTEVDEILIKNGREDLIK